MAWGAIAGAVIGGMMSSGAAGDSADAISGASGAATAAQERMFNKQVELQKPFRDSGLAANNRLAFLLGLSTTDGLGKELSYEQLRRQLSPQYMTQGRETLTPKYDKRLNEHGEYVDQIVGFDKGYEQDVDNVRLDAEINRIMQEQEANRKISPEFGSLMKSFGMEDFEADPGYAFRRSEGLKGVESGAAARGSLLSGSALKAIQKYGQDLASQEYGNAYGRFNADQTNKYNRLAGIVNTGQGATNQITNAAQNLGNATASNILNAGNAQAAGIVGSANAWNSAIGQGYNAYQQNELMNQIRSPGSNQSFKPSYGSWSGGNYQVD